MRTIIVLLLISFVFASQKACINDPFGPAVGYNLFSLGSVNGCQSDVQGRVALGGDGTFVSYSIGETLTEEADYSLIAAGDVDYNMGSVKHGGIIADSVTATNLGIVVNGHTYPSSCCESNSCGYCSSSATETSPIDFPAASGYLQDLSTYYSGLPSSGGTSIVKHYSTLTLLCNNALEYNVFSGVSLAGITSLQIQCAGTTSVLVNFSENNFQYLGLSLLGGITQERIVYHFSGTTVDIAGIAVLGSVFAPYANLQFNSGVIIGDVITANFGGDSCNIGQVNLAPFDGCLPVHVTPLFCCIYTNGDYTNGFCSEESCFELPGWTVTESLVEDCDDCCPCA